jgi:hypothetical protein
MQTLYRTVSELTMEPLFPKGYAVDKDSPKSLEYVNIWEASSKGFKLKEGLPVFKADSLSDNY